MARSTSVKFFVFFSLAITLLAALSTTATAQNPNPCTGTGVCALTWQQDTNLPTGSACSGCSYRTGENLSEPALTAAAIQNQNFGQLCSTLPGAVDGQIYAQPLVVTNVNWLGQGTNYNIAYVVTQNDTIYAINATPTSGNSTCSIMSSGSKSLLPSGQTAVNCQDIGSGSCGTIAPKVGILGTPVINISGSSGTIYIVAFSEDSSLAARLPLTIHRTKPWE